MQSVRTQLTVGQWNINGLQTKTQDKLRDAQVHSWIQSMDIAVLTETHLAKEDNIHIQGYRTFQANRQRNKKASRCSGGVALLVRRAIAGGVQRLPCSSVDMIWVLLDATFFGLPRDLAIGAIYEGPQQSAVTLRENREAFSQVQVQLDLLHADTAVMLIGDMNARTRMASDRIDTQHSTAQPKELWAIQGECTVDNRRNNLDTGTNGYGTHFLNLCRNNELLICNGRLEGDRRGMFTSFQKKGHSVVDYAAVTAALLPRVNSFRVGQLLGDISDHAPIMLQLKVKVGSSRVQSIKGREQGPDKAHTRLQKVLWGPEAPQKFRIAMQ